MHVTYGDIFNPEVWEKVVEVYVAKIADHMLKAYNLKPGEYALGAQGFSGALVAMAVGARLGLKVWIVRKEPAHGQSLEGLYPRTGAWVFIDDFIDTGKTLHKCVETIGSEPVCCLLYGSWATSDTGDRWNVWKL